MPVGVPVADSPQHGPRADTRHERICGREKMQNHLTRLGGRTPTLHKAMLVECTRHLSKGRVPGLQFGGSFRVGSELLDLLGLRLGASFQEHFWPFVMCIQAASAHCFSRFEGAST